MATDPYRHNVVALLHFDGADGSTTFTDETGRPWTGLGSAHISAEQSRFGQSLLLNGSSYLSTPNAVDVQLSAADFTIEAFIRPTSLTGYHAICARASYGSQSYYLYVHSSGGIGFYSSSSSNQNLSTAGGLIAVNTTHHVAVCRQGSILRLFVDGVMEASRSVNTFHENNEPLLIGRTNVSGYYYYYSGYIDEFRMTKGVARYTSNFTPPDAPFTITGPTVQGVVQIGDPPAPAARKVVLVRARDLLVVGSAVSDAVTGAYSADTDADTGDALMGIAYPDYGQPRAASTNYAIGDRTIPAVPTGHWYECESAGTTGTAEPVWPTDGSTVTDGTVVWRDKGLMEEPIARGPYVVPPDA